MATIARYSGSHSREFDSDLPVLGSGDLDLSHPPPAENSLVLLNRILAGRGLDIKEVLDTQLRSLSAGEEFPELAQAIPLIEKALTKSILVIGDYDADGTCSTALTILALRSIGATQTSYKLANRFSGGYGLSDEMMAEIVDEDLPHLVITVDHGTNSHEKLSRLLDLGVRVLVIDHHQPGREYRRLDHQNYRIVNPHEGDCRWSDKDLCATAVAFFVLASVRNSMVRQGNLQDREDNRPGRWLDMVALATVGDQMPMSKTNRILVEQGLRRIRAGRAREGIRHLLRSLDQAESKVYSRQLSHSIVPRLNAAGRIGAADVAVEFLLAESLTDAHRLAGELADLNDRRKTIEQEMSAEIDRQLAELTDASGLVCLSHPDWHIGVVGIGAAKVANKLNCPVIVFALHPQRKEWVGSGRSADSGDNILDYLDTIAVQEPGIFVNYGGHHQAVGATIKYEDMDKFKSLVDQLANQTVGNKENVLMTDGELRSEELTLENADWLSGAVAWGKELPLPLFDGVFEIRTLRRIGQNHVKFELKLRGADKTVEAIRFNCRAPIPEPGEKIRCVYELNAHRFRGSENLQLILRYWEAA